MEAALASGAADPVQYEQELAQIYLERVVGASNKAAASQGDGGKAGKRGGAAAAAAAAGEASAAAAAADEGEEAVPESLPEYGKLCQLVRRVLYSWPAGLSPSLGDERCEGNTSLLPLVQALSCHGTNTAHAGYPLFLWSPCRSWRAST